MSEVTPNRAKDLVRISELVERTGFCRRTIINLAKLNQIPAGFKIGRARCWKRSEIDAWLASR